MNKLRPYPKFFLFSLFYFAAVVDTPCQKPVTDSATVTSFGKVYLYSVPGDKPENLIIMISGDGGWKYGLPEFAKAFAGKGSVVAGVDILRYYRLLRQRNTDCFLVSSDFVELGAAVERRFSFSEYVPPLIMGYSSGATLVYGILAQARTGTFVGGISMGFCPDIELPKMLCRQNGLDGKELVQGKSYLLFPDSKLGNPWVVLHGRIDKVCDFQIVSEFVLKTTNARLITLPNVGHGFSKWADFMPQWKAATEELIKNYRQTHNSSSQIPDLKNIPYTLIREKAAKENKIIALIFSGDGGWYGFEQAIAVDLGSFGIPVIGIDTRKYFWSRKTPEDVASDVAGLLSYFGKKYNKQEYMLLGYSQGAEIIPFVYNRLPENLRVNVKSLILLSPETNTDFEVHISNMLGLGNSQNTYNVIDELLKIREPKEIFIFGDSEKTRIPGMLKNTQAEIVMIPGDHHYHGNASLIVKKIRDSGAF